MLEVPPATPMNNRTRCISMSVVLQVRKKQQRLKNDSFVASSSLDEVSSGDEYKESEELAAETADYEPEEEENTT